MKTLIWIPRVVYTLTGLLFIWSVLRDAPAIAMALQGLVGAGLMQVLLAIYSELVAIREAVES
jgi:hypothetical protein